MEVFEKLQNLIDENVDEDVRQKVEREREKLALELGTDPEEIRVGIDAYSDHFAQKGVVVGLNIGRERFVQSLSFKDIGINVDEVSDEFKKYLKTVYLGKRDLITPEYQEYMNALQRIEGKARNLLERNSFPIKYPFLRERIHFVPVDQYQDLKQELLDLKEEYVENIYRLADELDEIRVDTESMLQRAAVDVYKQGNYGKFPPDDYINNFVDGGMKSFPSREQVIGGAYFNIHTSMFSTGVSVNPEIKENKEIMRDINESLKEQKESFLSNIMQHLYSIVYDITTAARENIKKNGELNKKNINSLKRGMEQFEKLNSVVNDRQLAVQLAELNSMVSEGSRDYGEVALQLDALQKETRDVLDELGGKQRMARKATKIGIDDDEGGEKSAVKRKVNTVDSLIEPESTSNNRVVRASQMSIF